MSVLVAYATRHGATKGIAERIARRLTQDGVDAEAIAAKDVHDASKYDAYVVGSAAYMTHWLDDAKKFVKRNRATLAAHPTWLFSSGPIGTDLIDSKGRDVMVQSVPKEFDEMRSTLQPRGEKIFFGAFDIDAPPIGWAEKFARQMPAVAKDAIPNGDFRDWAAIDAWADEIAAALAPVPA